MIVLYDWVVCQCPVNEQSYNSGLFTLTFRLVMAGWWAFILFRWVFLLWPQTGYIHPDEFFQSVEVVSGMSALYYHARKFQVMIPKVNMSYIYYLHS